MTRNQINEREQLEMIPFAAMNLKKFATKEIEFSLQVVLSAGGA